MLPAFSVPCLSLSGRLRTLDVLNWFAVFAGSGSASPAAILWIGGNQMLSSSNNAVNTLNAVLVFHIEAVCRSQNSRVIASRASAKIVTDSIFHSRLHLTNHSILWAQQPAVSNPSVARHHTPGDITSKYRQKFKPTKEKPRCSSEQRYEHISLSGVIKNRWMQQKTCFQSSVQTKLHPALGEPAINMG
ncbi:hypothetical protein Nepgr_014682 [Nepenthes gracilis]|uniref:Uncharacterized protein n=1 Tax=Nepenthes gracilis TaxID=150966 RepID=A0AAD3XQJ9_NEPGR|nr:hypothetical protein Nepgr_014682 [Nepenthes gracilis]